MIFSRRLFVIMLIELGLDCEGHHFIVNHFSIKFREAIIFIVLITYLQNVSTGEVRTKIQNYTREYYIFSSFFDLYTYQVLYNVTANHFILQ